MVTILRQCACQGYYRRPLCDRPVDALWNENSMNTMLDDHKMLCMANSKLTPSTEVETACQKLGGRGLGVHEAGGHLLLHPA